MASGSHAPLACIPDGSRYGILFHLLVGGRSIITRSGSFGAREVVDVMERERVTGCYFLPTQWKALCELPGLETA